MEDKAEFRLGSRKADDIRDHCVRSNRFLFEKLEGEIRKENGTNN